MESTPRPGLTRRQFFAALLAPFLVRFARWFRPAPASTTLTAAAPSSPTTIAVAGGMSDTLVCGDVFVIDGWHQVNPRTGEPTGRRQTFRVTAVNSRREVFFEPAA